MQVPVDPVIQRVNPPKDAGKTNDWEEMARNIGNSAGLPTQSGANKRTEATPRRSSRPASSLKSPEANEVAELRAQLLKVQQELLDLKEQRSAATVASVASSHSKITVREWRSCQLHRCVPVHQLNMWIPRLALEVSYWNRPC